MEKRLRSSVHLSADELLSSATKLSLKSSKSSLKTLIHSLPSSSPLLSSLPLSLHHYIRSLLEDPHPPPPASDDPAVSPPTKRLRRSSRKNNPQHKDPAFNVEREKELVLEKLRTLAHITFLCVSHPKSGFSPTDLLPAVQCLHDNLILLECDQNLLSEISNLCEEYWKENLPGREMLISQSLPFLVSRSLTLKKKVDVHRVYMLREAFTLFDFEDESIEDLKLLLVRCVIAPLYLKTDEGRKFLAFMFGLSRQLLKEALAMIRSQIPFGRKSILESYGEVLFRAWKGVEVDLKEEIENEFLQGLIEGAIHASSRTFAASIRRVLGGFISQKIADGVEKLLFRLAEPVLFRSLQVANSNVRLNALHLLLDLFPIEDPEAMKETKDTLLDKQLFLLERLLVDDCPDVRVVAVEGCCRVLQLFWEIIPSSTITKLLTNIFDDMTHDICYEVRLSTLNGIVYLLGNPQSHEILKVLLPRLGHMISDNVLSVRIAVVDLLLLIRDIRTFQFNKVVSLDVLLSTLTNDQSQVAQKITRLLMPSYFPSKVSTEDACSRCVTLLKRSPQGGARFCEFIVSEGASLVSVMELVKVLINLVLSSDKMKVDQVEGLFAASAYICNNLVSESYYSNALKELFSGGKVKRLFAAASTPNSHASILSIFAIVSPDDVSCLMEECMLLVTNCSGLCENEDKQVEVRSAHKLLLSCNGFDDTLEAFTRLLQKTAYRCHLKFGTEKPEQRISPKRRKKCKSSVKLSAKWKHVNGKKTSNFDEEYDIAVGISWQIRDLLLSEKARKALLGSEDLELSFLALKVISEASICQCICCEYMDTSPVLAYAALAFHMTLQNITLSGSKDSASTKNDRTGSSTSNSKTILDQTADHLLNCVERLLSEANAGTSGCPPSNSTKDKKAGNNDDGLCYSKGKRMSNMVKILTAVLKFVVDSLAMGFLPQIHVRCLSFTSAYIKHIIFALRQQSSEQLEFKEDELKEVIPCLKSSFSYAAKLLNLVLGDGSEASPPCLESLDLANNLFDLIILMELCMGSQFAGRFIAVAKSWLPDLILALGSVGILKQNQVEGTHLTVLHHIKSYFPSWPLILAKHELHEIVKVSQGEEDDTASDKEELVVFKKLMETMVSLLKGNRKILDAVGVILLSSSVVGLERQDFGVVLGLLHFVCLKLVGEEDREWSELDMMLTSLPDIYPLIEREIQEQEDNEDNRPKLESARALLEPVWFYHVYETGRFSMMEE